MRVNDVENQDMLQEDEVYEVSTISGSSLSLQDLETLNHNIVTGFLYVTGALGIIVGCILGIAFHGIFRSK